jgi:hypothetical protein
MTQNNKFKNWVNSEVDKELDKEPFSSLPIKMRIGILILTGSFIVGHGSNIFLWIMPGINHKLSIGGFLHGSYIYITCWLLGTIGLSLAGKDSIKYPIYFFAKFTKKLFPSYFEKENHF